MNSEDYEPYFNHPLTQDQITEGNYSVVADDLFKAQLAANVEYFSRIIKTNWWSDDDTDYITSALDATKALMDIAYDGSRDDLIKFLFSLRDIDNYHSETLADIDSGGGGFCNELNSYLPND